MKRRNGNPILNRQRINNPKNPTNALFKKMTRIFSGPIVQLKQPFGHGQRRRDLERYSFDLPHNATFAKNRHDPFQFLYSRSFVEATRQDRYSDFEQMEQEPIISRALNTYAYEITSASGLRNLLTIECDNDQLRLILEDLFYNILNVKQNLFGWVRNMCKYGNHFLYLDIKEGKGIRNCLSLPVNEIEILLGEDETNPNYIQYHWHGPDTQFENFQIANFHMGGQDRHFPYSAGVLDPARRVFRQLSMIESHMMSYRMVRSSERLVFYLQVGNIAPQDVEQFIEKAATQFKRSQVADPHTGRVDIRYNPAAVEEDIYIPVRGEHSSRIETLKGGDMTAQIDDVKYIAEKMYTAINIPQSYLSRGEGSDDGSSLAQKDVSFANVIMNIQTSVVAELTKIAIVHLVSLGYEGKDLLSYNIHLNGPSKILEMQELESLRVRLEVAAQASESGFFSRREIAMTILKKTAKEFERTQLERFYDAKYDARLEAMKTMAEGGLGGEHGGDLGTLPDMEDLAEEPSPMDDGPQLADAEDNVLLAAPGMPRPGQLSTAAVTDGRQGFGPRRRSMKSRLDAEQGRSTMRNIRKGMRGVDRVAAATLEEEMKNYFRKMEQILSESRKTENDVALENSEHELLGLNSKIDRIFGENNEE